jgi:hypothetical protein
MRGKTKMNRNGINSASCFGSILYRQIPSPISSLSEVGGDSALLTIRFWIEFADLKRYIYLQANTNS